jgi:hypothetical protein
MGRSTKTPALALIGRWGLEYDEVAAREGEEAAPHVSRIAVLLNPDNLAARLSRRFEWGGNQLGLALTRTES